MYDIRSLTDSNVRFLQNIDDTIITTYLHADNNVLDLFVKMSEYPHGPANLKMLNGDFQGGLLCDSQRIYNLSSAPRPP